MARFGVLLLAFVTLGCSAIGGGVGERTSSGGVGERTSLQEGRRALIRDLIDRGIFQKIEKRAKFPHLYVRPAFYALDFDTKEEFVNVVYAYYVTDDPEADLVVLKDSRSGKKIGVYGAEHGGLSLD